MNKKIKFLLMTQGIFNVVFAIAGIAVMVFGTYYTVINSDTTQILPTIYSFFHTLIAGFAAFFAFRAYKKGSVIMRTLMYVDDYEEKTVSPVARVVTLVIGGIFLIIALYFGFSFIYPELKLVFWTIPLFLRIVLVNVGLFIFINMVIFFFFPLLYDMSNDINPKHWKKGQ